MLTNWNEENKIRIAVYWNNLEKEKVKVFVLFKNLN